MYGPSSLYIISRTPVIGNQVSPKSYKGPKSYGSRLSAFRRNLRIAENSSLSLIYGMEVPNSCIDSSESLLGAGSGRDLGSSNEWLL